MIDKIKGTGVALVTPFKHDNSIDYAGLEKLQASQDLCQEMKNLKL